MVDKRIAVVTGGNKGLGFETCRKLASNGITVILAARNKKNGTEAVQKLKEYGLSDVVFHPLDVKDSASISSLAKFMETNYKKLDILVNNAGEGGVIIHMEKLSNIKDGAGIEVMVNDEYADLLKRGIMIQTHEMAVECIKTNYYGTKGVTQALLPLLQLSKSARIVNVTSFLGQLTFINNEEVKAALSNVETLTEETIDKIVQGFLRDFKDDKLKRNGWPLTSAAYKVSKCAVNAYTKLMARKYPGILINCVHPGYAQTDMTSGSGPLTPEQGARAPTMVALLPDHAPTGRYFNEMQLSHY